MFYLTTKLTIGCAFGVKVLKTDWNNKQQGTPAAQSALQGHVHALPSCEEDIELKDLVERGKTYCNPRHVPESVRAPKKISGFMAIRTVLSCFIRLFNP